MTRVKQQHAPIIFGRHAGQTRRLVHQAEVTRAGNEPPPVSGVSGARSVSLGREIGLQKVARGQCLICPQHLVVDAHCSEINQGSDLRGTHVYIRQVISTLMGTALVNSRVAR